MVSSSLPRRGMPARPCPQSERQVGAGEGPRWGCGDGGGSEPGARYGARCGPRYGASSTASCPPLRSPSPLSLLLYLTHPLASPQAAPPRACWVLAHTSARSWPRRDTPYGSHRGQDGSTRGAHAGPLPTAMWEWPSVPLGGPLPRCRHGHCRCGTRGECGISGGGGPIA